uniref:PHD finger protein 10 n=2 Tax=Caenorhabditis japonica TaxID=281687 RepID=A0A8R1EAP7_CAEJA
MWAKFENCKAFRCATCQIMYHPQCIEMPDRMAALVKTYEWSCVDCRVCSVCYKPEKEDQIVFCDRCDRGFHTFCVGLKQAPRGTWICEIFCGSKLTPMKGKPAGKR